MGRQGSCLLVAIVAVAVMLASCAPKGRDLEHATLVEGRGLEPGLVVGATTLSQARAFLGQAAGEASVSGPETTMTAGPLRLVFITPEAGGEGVLHAIRTARVPNPQFPRWKGRSSRGIGFLDSDDKVRAAYGPPAAEWRQSFGGTSLYYTSGVVFVLEHPSNITGYDGPPPSPTSIHVREVWVTVPFEIVEAPGTVQSGQLVVNTPPRTTLRIALF